MTLIDPSPENRALRPCDPRNDALDSEQTLVLFDLVLLILKITVVIIVLLLFVVVVDILLLLLKQKVPKNSNKN